MSAVIFAVALAIFSWCIALGEHEQMVRDALKIYTGHIQIHDKGYWEDRTIYNSFVPPRELTDFLEKDERIKAYVKRVNIDTLISHEYNTNGILLVGVEPERENKFSSMAKKVVRGGYLDPSDPEGILIGETLARNIDADVSDEITIITQDYYGAMSAANFIVTGIFSSGSSDMDRSMAFINLGEMQYLISMDDLVSEVTILLGDSRNLKKVNRDIVSIVDLEKYEVMPWQELMPELVQFIEFDNAFGYIFYFMILLVVIFGILNTILMAVMERYREFGVMMALGTKPREIIRLIMCESALIALLGIVIGNLIGFGFAFYFTKIPIDFSAYSEVVSSFGLDPLIYARMYPWVFYVSDSIILVSTLLAAIYPAVKAANLKPVDALRHV